MPNAISRRLSAAVCSLAALGAAPGLWGQTPVLEPSQVIEAPADPGPVQAFNQLGASVELEGNRLLLRTSAQIARLFDIDQQGDWNQHSVVMLPQEGYAIWDLALAGDTAVVLAYRPSGEADILGRLYVFRANQPQWNLVQTIDLPDDGVADWVSGSLDFDGKTIAAGASFDSAVYVYTQNSTGTFALTATIQEPAAPFLGASVAIQGNLLMAGAPAGLSGGSVYVYRRARNTWHLMQELKASDGAASDNFGSTLSLKGGRVAITAENADRSEESSWDRGAVYVFAKTGGQWLEEQKIERPSRGSFGKALELDARRLVVRAPNIVVEGGGFWFARAYAYEYRHGAWSLVAELGDPSGQSNSFAPDLAIEGRRVITTNPDVQTPDPLFDGQAYEYLLPGSP